MLTRWEGHFRRGTACTKAWLRVWVGQGGVSSGGGVRSRDVLETTLKTADLLKDFKPGRDMISFAV